MLFIPIIVSTAIIPAFKDQIINNIIDESKRVALHLSKSIDYRNNNIDEIDELVGTELNEFQIEKIHYFDKNGKVIYSTRRDNIGTINTKPYFRDIVAKGEIYYKIDHKGGKTSDGDYAYVDMIEIYIPFMVNGEFDSSFELYYNITEEGKRFVMLSKNVTIVNILISLTLGIIMFIMLYNASRTNLKKDKLLKYNLKIQENLKAKTNELLGTNENLSQLVNDLAKTQNKLIEAEKIASKARKTAEDANRDKSVFLANVSHELKTPLNGITGLVYLSKLRIKDAETIKNLNSIQKYSEALLRMIGDLLDSSKMEAKEITIEKSVFNLEDMIESVNQLYTMQCNDKNIKFVLDYDKNIPKNLISDSVRIHQVITNLLNNAVKFTDNGKVELRVEIQSKSENKIRIKFEVKDDGIGIKEEELKNIFQPFYQTKESLNHYAGGSGLGLNICQKIVEKLDGIIWAESKNNQGSSFYVLLEFEEPKYIENATKSENYLEYNLNKKVLVVDDNKINREVMDGILKSVGIKCDMAVNGLEALSLASENKYDIILTDIKMPVMDGYEFSKQFRKNSLDYSLPIIAISANYSDEDLKYASNCGINDYIKKPINPEKFLLILSKYLGYKIGMESKIVSSSFKSNNILDLKSALVRFVNNEKLYKSTLKFFINDYKDSCEEIKSLLNDYRINELIDYLHTIKGVSANLSAVKFTKIAGDFHDAIKYGKKYSKLIDEYEESFNELVNEVNSYISDDVEDVKLVTQTEISNRDKILNNILSYAKEYNTKTIQYFNSLDLNIKNDIFINELENDILNYNFKSIVEKIEKYFNGNK